MNKVLFTLSCYPQNSFGSVGYQTVNNYKKEYFKRFSCQLAQSSLKPAASWAHLAMAVYLPAVILMRA